MIEEFRQAINPNGFNFTDDIIPDCKLRRIHAEGDKGGAFRCLKRNVFPANGATGLSVPLNSMTISN